MEGITAEMRIRGALPLLSPAEQISLQYWAAEFGMPLCEFHVAITSTCDIARGWNAEVSVLLRLLESIDLGDEFRRRYEPLRDAGRRQSDAAGAVRITASKGRQYPPAANPTVAIPKFQTTTERGLPS